MADKRDCYEILGVNKSASDDEIKKAYRSLAKKYHPDNKDTGDEVKFKEIQESYDILSDPKKKQLYDQYGYAGVDPNAQGGFGAGGNPFEGFGGADFDLGDIFSSMFGGGRSRSSRRGPTKGQDRFIKLNIDFMDAVFGKNTEFKIDLDEQCPDCKGTGARNNSFSTCSQCNGSGRMYTVQNSMFGQIRQETTCNKCNGSGKVISDPCPTCSGSGYINKRSTVEITIPAGINSRQQLRLSGKGYKGSFGGPNGDLYVEIVIKDHPYFERDGSNIHITVPISFADAALGCKKDIPTVYGDVELTIPAGIQSGQTLRIKGKGIKQINSNVNGDEFVHIEVKTPTVLNRKEKELFKALQDVEKEDNIFEKFKKKFKN